MALVASKGFMTTGQGETGFNMIEGLETRYFLITCRDFGGLRNMDAQRHAAYGQLYRELGHFAAIGAFASMDEKRFHRRKIHSIPYASLNSGE